MFVTGWGGSVGKTDLIQDEQLNHFISHLVPYKYTQGCNLFYATDTSPHLSLDENAEVIRDNICSAAAKIKRFNPEWNGHLSIIGHSYGGLRARAYLENSALYPGDHCSGEAPDLQVDHLFTLGTPHSGEEGGLPLSSVIGLMAVKGEEWPAIKEMLPPVRYVQNQRQQQPRGTEYYFISGDARSQVLSRPLLLLFVKQWPQTFILSNDLAVKELSALGMDMSTGLYPRVTRIKTGDLHGDIFSSEGHLLDTQHTLKSYVYPGDTFNKEICGRLGLSGCQSAAAQQSIETASTSRSVEKMAAELQEPVTNGPMPLMEIATGPIAAGEVLEGQFDLTGDGPWQIMLNWAGGEVELTLTDPNGRLIDEDTAGSNPTIIYVALDIGFGLMASYTFEDTLPGTWSWRVKSPDNSTVFRLAVLPPVPIAVSAAVPEWTPAATPVLITAFVSFDATTPITGGTVVAEVAAPGGQTEILTLYDDGLHNDGAPHDGVFGANYTPPLTGGHFSLLVTATGNYEDEPYQRDTTGFFTVAPPSAALTDSYSDHGVDENGDEKFDFLEVTTNVEVEQTGTLGLSAELFSGSTFISSASVKTAFTSGIRQVALRFPAEDIIAAQLDGPYTVRNVMLTDETGVTLLIEVADFVHSTMAYQVSQFTPPNQPPNVPADPNLKDGAISIPVTAALSWSATDPDDDPLTHEVRFGTTNPPLQVVAGQSATTYDPPGDLAYSTTYYWQIVANDGRGGETPGPVWSFTTVDEPTPFPNTFYISPSNNKTIGGIAAASADILRYEKSTDTWTMIYDGSVRGTTKNVSAFDIMDDGSLLLVFSANQKMTIEGSTQTATPYDVVKFTPYNPNVFPLGGGTYEWYFRGKTHDLSTGAEKIDALDYAGNRLLLSTTGTAKITVSGASITVTKEDVFAYNTTTDQWESTPVIDGSIIPELKGKNISSVWDDPNSDDYYVTVTGAFKIGGVKGNAQSIVKLTPSGSSFTPSFVDWLAPGQKFPSNLDGLDIAP